MIKNHIKFGFRSLFRQKGFSFINILGLSVGLVVFLLISLWIRDEIRFDRFHSGGDRLYRLLANLEDKGSIHTWPTTPYPLIEYLSSNHPEIEAIGGYDPTNKKQFVVDGQEILADGIYADPGFFKVLSFPFEVGKSRKVFDEPNAVVISESMAEKLFGESWKGQTVGELLSINGSPDYKVTGVFKNVLSNSSLTFDFALNLDELHEENPGGFPWGNYDTKIICKLKENVNPAAFKSKIAQAINLNNEHVNGSVTLITQLFNRKYLYDQFENGQEAGGRINYVRLFGIAAIFLLIIACINFMNLATARASRRAKEVGVRKTIGAGKSALVSQFLTEAGIITLVSIVGAIGLVVLLLPGFEELTGKELYSGMYDPELWSVVALVGLATALLAGSYPAFLLSSFRITHVLKGDFSLRFGSGGMRRALVVFQFVISVLLVIGTLVVQNQVDYIKNKHLGLDKEHVLYFRIPSKADENPEAYRSELSRLPGIHNITFSSNNPLEVGAQTGDPQWEGMAPGDNLLFKVLLTDDQFLSTLNIPLASGRDFLAVGTADTVQYLVNETAAKAMNLDQPLGKNLSFWGSGGPIVGVVKDFHIGSLAEAIGPLIIGYIPENTGLTLLRIDPKRTEEVIAASETLFKQFSSGQPFRYDFLDERFLQAYRSEERISSLSKWFALIALFISCLGLLGLSAYMAERKTKEISIRKVLGASVANIVYLLSKDFLKLILIALVIAFPVGWYMVDNWLSNYAFRVGLSWQFFALAGGAAVFVALFTVGFQSIKAALVHPVKSLKKE